MQHMSLFLLDRPPRDLTRSFFLSFDSFSREEHIGALGSVVDLLIILVFLDRL